MWYRKHQAQKNTSGTNRKLQKLYNQDDRKFYNTNWAARALENKLRLLVRLETVSVRPEYRSHSLD